MVVHDGQLLDFRKIRLEPRAGLAANQGVKRVFDLFGSHRITIGKLGFRVDVEGRRTEIGGHLNIIGKQSILGIRLVQAIHREGFKHQFQQTRRDFSFQGERVVFVKAAVLADDGKIKQASFGGIGVDIVKMLEIGGIFRLAKLGHAVGGKDGRRESQV